MKRYIVAGWLGWSATVSAQQPITPASVPTIPSQGPAPIIGPSLPRNIPNPVTEPNQLPPSVVVPPQQPQNPNLAALEPLPREEGRFKLDVNALQIRRLSENTQIIGGMGLFRDFGKFDKEAEDVVRMLRTMRPQEWATIGGPRPIVEYGLRNGKATDVNPMPRWCLPVDPMSVKTQQVRGVWVVRDEANILLNFGSQRGEAEQATAVIKRYQFNRLGLVGFPNAVFSFLYAVPAEFDKSLKMDANAMLNAASQEQQLIRTGIPVPGIGFVGEKIAIDPKKVEVRKDRNDVVLAHGTEILGRFGVNDWVARDALRLIQDCRFTEYCTFGQAGVSFFLVNGRAPTRVPFFAQGVKFDAKNLKARNTEGNRWGLFEPTGRMIFPAATQQEAEQLLRLIQTYQFDTYCTAGGSSTSPGLRFLAQTGGR